MHKATLKKKVLAVMFLPLLLISCNRQDEKTEAQQPRKAVEQEEAVKPASLLSLVPDDTIFFFGGLEPVPLKESLQWNLKHFQMPDSIDPKEMLGSVKNMAESQGQLMILQLWAEHYKTVVSQKDSLDSWGIADSPLIAAYAVGLVPVLRISLKDVSQFQKKMEEIEGKAQVKAEPETVGSAVFKRYPLLDSEQKISLIIGTDKQHAVFLLDFGIESEQVLSLVALGQSKPEKSLAESKRLESLRAEYKLDPAFVGYVDHRQIVTGLTTKDGNRMAKMVQKLAAKLPEQSAKSFAELQTEGCQKDFHAMAANWPRLIFGYTAFDLKSTPSRMDSITVLESKDKTFLDRLRSLRGFIPDYTDNPAAFSFALGLAAENIGPFLMQQWGDLTSKQYSCAPLQEGQNELKTTNPAMLSMAAAGIGMAAGVRGLAFSLFDLQMDKSAQAEQAQPMPKSIDALLSLSAINPRSLVHNAAAVFPPAATLQLPADNSPVELPIPIDLPTTPSAAVNGSHLTVYVGEQGEKAAKALADATLESSQGIMAVSMDYGKYFQMAGDLAAYAGAEEESADAAAILDSLKKAKVRVQMKVDFTERGIEMSANMLGTE